MRTTVTVIRVLLAELLARLFWWATSPRPRCFEIPTGALARHPRRFDA